MNILEHFSELHIDANMLTAKKQQTDKKIQYVSEYVRLWAYVMLERSNIDTLDFIDCMSNAGVYRDGDCCTAVEVLRIFSELAEAYPHKLFRVFCNDNDPQKIEILRNIFNSGIFPIKKNVSIFTSQQDVNDYLTDLCGFPVVSRNEKTLFAYGSATILYVDPFDFGTVEIPKVSAVLQKHYCELIFNFFISDYVRNIAKDSGRIAKCLGGQTITTKDDLVAYMRSNFKVGNVEHLFSYQFKTQTNVELYQIVFATPSLRGLEKLKEVLWKVFNGAEFHRNKTETDQFTFFTQEYDETLALSTYAAEAKELLATSFPGQTVTWSELEKLLVEHTMLKESHIIQHVLKPMIAKGNVIKCNNHGKANFKKDSFTFCAEGAVL